jgi:hypothetical protein
MFFLFNLFGKRVVLEVKGMKGHALSAEKRRAVILRNIIQAVGLGRTQT